MDEPTPPVTAPAADSLTPLPQVSVVTLLSSGGKELRQCIESVLAQSHTAFELLLIACDPNPQALAVSEEYARSDSRLRVVRADPRLDRLGAYNFALGELEPRSAYFKIVDPREWLMPTCLHDMVALAAPSPSVAIVSSYRTTGSVTSGTGLDRSRNIISGRDACRLHLLDGIFLFGAPTRLLFRTELLEDRLPFFTPGRLHADTEAVFEILANRDFGFVHRMLSSSSEGPAPRTPIELSFGAPALDRLILVSQYGPVYLDASEYDRCLQGAVRWYYSVLGRAWLNGLKGQDNAEFWDYHNAGLKTIGEKIRPELLALAVARLTAKKILGPWRALRGEEEEPLSFRPGRGR